MDKITPSLIMDVVLGLLLLWKILQGWSQGAFKRLGGLASAVFSIIGARIVRDHFAAQVSDSLLLPKVTEVLEHARESIGVSDLMANLREILNSAKLPAFAKLNVADEILSRAGETLDSAVNTAAEVVSMRISEWLLFIVAVLVIYLLLKLIFNFILEPVVQKLPLIKWVDKLLGMALGLCSGIILVGMVLWLGYHLLPNITVAGRILSAESIEASWIAKQYFHFFPTLFL